MQEITEEMTPFINRAISTIFGINRTISSYDQSLGQFKHTESFLFPTSFDVESHCIHFTPEFIDDEKDFIFFDKSFQNQIRNIIRLIKYFDDFFIMRHRLSIKFNKHFNIKSFKLIINFNFSNIDYQKGRSYMEPTFTEKFVVRFENIKDTYIKTNNKIFFEKLEDVQKKVLLAYMRDGLDFSLDFLQNQEDFEKSLLVLDMYKI